MKILFQVQPVTTTYLQATFRVQKRAKFLAGRAKADECSCCMQTGRMTNSSIAQTLVAIVREEGVQGWFR